MWVMLVFGIGFALLMLGCQLRFARILNRTRERVAACEQGLSDLGSRVCMAEMEADTAWRSVRRLSRKERALARLMRSIRFREVQGKVFLSGGPCRIEGQSDSRPLPHRITD